MTTFRDGPAAGTTLMLHRAPLFLRVVISPTGHVDALDQPEDTALPGERVHVYQRAGEARLVHLSMANRRQSGFYQMAEYEHRSDVDGETVRETSTWRAWAMAQPEAEQVL
jgi:hypothetical protein